MGPATVTVSPTACTLRCVFVRIHKWIRMSRYRCLSVCASLTHFINSMKSVYFTLYFVLLHIAMNLKKLWCGHTYMCAHTHREKRISWARHIQLETLQKIYMNLDESPCDKRNVQRFTHTSVWRWMCTGVQVCNIVFEHECTCLKACLPPSPQTHTVVYVRQIVKGLKVQMCDFCIILCTVKKQLTTQLLFNKITIFPSSKKLVILS